MLTGRQCAAARMLIKLSQEDLADRAGVNIRTVIDFENDRRKTSEETKERLVAVLKAAGICLYENNGVATIPQAA